MLLVTFGEDTDGWIEVSRREAFFPLRSELRIPRLSEDLLIKNTLEESYYMHQIERHVNAKRQLGRPVAE
jgi:hypothetical protein